MKKPGTQHDVEHRVSWGSQLIEAGRVQKRETNTENEVLKTWQECAGSLFADFAGWLPVFQIFSMSFGLGAWLALGTESAMMGLGGLLCHTFECPLRACWA